MKIDVYPMAEMPSERIQEFIKAKKSFVIDDIDRLNLGDYVEAIEKVIEAEGLKVRVYTKGRSAAVVGSVFGGITAVAGIATAVGIAAHNAATWNPDYEIAKNLATGSLTLTYKK